MRSVAVGLVAACSLSACATAAVGAGEPAMLVQAADTELRQAIRAFVREDIGPDYIAEPDALLQGSVMVASDRGRPREGKARILEPTEHRYSLVMDDAGCRLVRDGSDAVMALPTSAQCRRAAL